MRWEIILLLRDNHFDRNKPADRLAKVAFLRSSHFRKATGTVSRHSHSDSSSAIMGRVFHMAGLAVEAEGPKEATFS